MVKVVGIKFKKVGKIYYFDPGNLDIPENSFAIVETARGIEYGKVVIPIIEVNESSIVQPLKKVIRIATFEDEKHNEENQKKEKEAFNTCLKKIQDHHLNMKLIDVEYTFDNNKILFYFTADGRIDFRELVKDLASVFKTRIELRQIGVRDECKLMGGLGICGRTLCCHSFLGEFQPVSIKMAKEQNLSLNPSKISGTCGRLMCCLKYEHETYEHLQKNSPKIGAIVSTHDGQGVVVETNILKQTIKVRLDKENETDLKVYPISKISIIKDVDPDDTLDVDIDMLKELED